MTMVAASKTGKFPASVARLISPPSPVIENVCPRKRKYSAMMLAFHAPGGGDEAGDQVRTDRRQQQFAPALDVTQVKDFADFFQVGRYGACACNHVEKDVALRPQQQEDNRG